MSPKPKRFDQKGRNPDNWFRDDAGVNERYDYLYSAEELQPWLDRARQFERGSEQLFVFTNNHFEGKPCPTRQCCVPQWTAILFPSLPRSLTSIVKFCKELRGPSEVVCDNTLHPSLAGLHPPAGPPRGQVEASRTTRILDDGVGRYHNPIGHRLPVPRGERPYALERQKPVVIHAGTSRSALH